MAMKVVVKLLASWCVGVFAMLDFRDFALSKTTSVSDVDGHGAFVLRKVLLRFNITTIDFNQLSALPQTSSEFESRLRAGIAADVGIGASDISVVLSKSVAPAGVLVEADISTISTGRPMYEMQDSLESSTTLAASILQQLSTMDLSLIVQGSLTSSSFSDFFVMLGNRPGPNADVIPVPKFTKFVKPDMPPASFMYALNQYNPPYSVDNATLPAEPFPGCDAKHASVCSVQNAIRLVTHAKADVCEDLQAGGSRRKAALKRITDDQIKVSGSTGFGVFAFERDGIILADALKPAFVGYSIDGYLASALVAQPTLLDHVDWVVSWGGGFVPHYTTRITPATLSEMVNVFNAPQSVAASMYVEECGSGERIAVAFGREALPAVESCSPNYNGLCAVQNIRRLVGLNLVDFLNSKDFEEVAQQNHEISYGGGSGRYSVGVFYSMRYLMSNWGYPGSDPWRNEAPMPDTSSTCFGIGGGLTKRINGRNVTWLPGDLSADVRSAYPNLKRGDWLVAEMSEAAYRGGAWTDYAWNIPALGDHHKVSLSVGVKWNGTATFLATGTVHIPAPAAMGPVCTQCVASESLPCATLTAERLVGHALVEMLTPKGNWPRISNDPWFGADHNGAWTNTKNGERWPNGFYVFAFSYNGTCVADGHTLSNIGRRWDEIYAGSGVSASGIDEKFKFAADNGGGWISFPGLDGLKKLAFVSKLSKGGSFEYFAVGVSMRAGILDTRCFAAYAESCSERNAEKLVGLANAEILAAADPGAFDQILETISKRSGQFSSALTGDFEVEIYDSTWQCIKNSSGSPMHNCSSGFTNEEKTVLDALPSGSWGKFKSGTEIREHVYVMHVAFKLSHKIHSSNFQRDIRLMLRVQPAYQPGRCSTDSDCPANAMCSADSTCRCKSNFQARFALNSSSCGELPNSVMQCVDVKGLNCPACPKAGCLIGFQCQPCAAGFYCPEGVQEACPSGQYCTVGSWKPTPCPEGTYFPLRKATSKNDCKVCPAGTIAISPGKTQCTECGLGEIAANNGSTICDQCRRGEYASERGSSQCTPCGGSLTTESMASRFASDCVCPLGQYRSSSDRTQCLQCKDGMSCAWGADAELGSEVSPVLMSGFWSSNDDPLSVFRCRDDKRCTGGNPVKEKVCQENMEESRACEVCRSGWVWDGDQCSECGALESSWIMFPLLPLVLTPLMIVFLYKVFGDTCDRWGNWTNGIASIAFIVLNHYQIISLTPNIDMLPPRNFASVVSSFGWTDGSEMFHLSCTGFGDFKSKLILKATTPAFLAVMYLLVWLLSQLIGKCGWPDLAMERNRTYNGYFSLMFTFFAGICGSAFALFKCSPNPNHQKTLTIDRSIMCNSDEWNSMLVVAVLAILFWIVGLGSLFLRALFMTPERFTKPIIQMRWKFLFIKFRPDVHWWAIVIVLKGISLNIVFVACETAMGQINFMFFTILAYICLAVAYQPWRHVYVNAVDIWAHMCLLLLGAVLMWFASADAKANTKTAEEDMQLMGIISCFFVVPTILPVMCQLWWSQNSQYVRQKRREKAALIQASFKFVGKSDASTFAEVLGKMGEWDRNALMRAHDVVENVLMGHRRHSYRYTARGLTSSFPTPPPSPASKLALETSPEGSTTEENSRDEWDGLKEIIGEESSHSGEMDELDIACETGPPGHHGIDMQQCLSHEAFPHAGFTRPELMV